ncbi:penicillin-binding transpeptidase domain-containing protein [Catellatospora coxensis]
MEAARPAARPGRRQTRPRRPRPQAHHPRPAPRHDARGDHGRHRHRPQGHPGGAVYGKTGTAEYDNNPAHTHAWFIGWQGDIAFAVFIENGIKPSETAVPVTESFLRNLR